MSNKWQKMTNVHQKYQTLMLQMVKNWQRVKTLKVLRFLSVYIILTQSEFRILMTTASCYEAL